MREQSLAISASIKATVSGEINTFLGFRFYVLGDRDEGGLPLATNDRTCFAFHRSAVGMAVNMAQKTEINYVPEKTSFLVNSMFSSWSCFLLMQMVS